MAKARYALYVAVLAIPVVHTVLAPYTKVEESFTLHAARDVLRHGVWGSNAIDQYDHRTFPGAVPRSFIPALIWATFSSPVISLGKTLGWIKTGLDEQICLRIILSLLNSLSTIRLARSLRRTTRSGSTSILFLILGATQFHVNFYAGRPLPNFMALPLVNLALSWILDGNKNTTRQILFNRTSAAIAILAWSCSVIRSELALLLGPITIYLLLARRISIVNAIIAGFTGGAGGAVMSVLVDSYFWGRWTWPEMEAVVFNVVEGKSDEWGVSPWYSYVLIHLPKLTLFSLPLAVYALVTGAGNGLKGIALTGIVGLVAGMSCLGHKEWRFIVYVVPLVNMLAASGASQLWQRATGRKSLLDKLGGLILVGGILANLVVTLGLTFVSVNNYPGGEVMQALKSIGAGTGRNELRVFLPPSVLQTGASRYTFEQADVLAEPLWEFNRTESRSLQTPGQLWAAGFDYVITDEADRFAEAQDADWSIERTIHSFGGISLKPSPRIVWRPALSILSRHSGSEV